MTPESCLSVQTSCADICWRAVSSAFRAVSASCTVATPSVTGTELTSSDVPSGKAVVTAPRSDEVGPRSSRATTLVLRPGSSGMSTGSGTSVTPDGARK